MNEDILKMKKLQPEGTCPVMVAQLPKQIIKEIDVWVRECRKIKNDPLASLKVHENAAYGYQGIGKAHNSYQCSVPGELVRNSYWLAFAMRLTSKYWGLGTHQRFFGLRECWGHFDGFDIWANFAYKGDHNPTHHHTGFLSGVIYHQNHGHPTYFDDYNCAYEGKNGTMVLFPASVRHHVEHQVANKERITFAFNIVRTEHRIDDPHPSLPNIDDDTEG